jgi:hypothetical protein
MTTNYARGLMSVSSLENSLLNSTILIMLSKIQKSANYVGRESNV